MEYLLKRGERIISVFGMDIVQMDDVFPSDEFPSTEIFGKWLGRNASSGSSILEIGAGNGAISLYLSELTGANVMATDINPVAIDNIRINFNKRNQSRKLKALVSDVFENIQTDMRFDLIYWNTPFMYSEDTGASKTFYDLKYKSIEKFIETYDSHLNSSGRAIIGFGSIGNLGLLNELAVRNKRRLIIRDCVTIVEPAGQFDYLILEVETDENVR